MIIAISCGATAVETSAAFVELNNKMMALMSVEYSCDHSIDFVRQMIPHHAAAIEMCDIVVENTKGDEYLVELCSNITLTQKAEISWMYEWLTERDIAVAAPCDEQCDESKFMSRPCEDLLSTSSFCHGLSFAQDGYCRCDETFANDQFSCDNVSYIQGVGVFTPGLECKRTCGLCSMDEFSSFDGGDMAWSGEPGNLRKLASIMDENNGSIWPHSCYVAMDNSGQGGMHGDHIQGGDDMHANDHSNMHGGHSMHGDMHSDHGPKTEEQTGADDFEPGDYDLLPSNISGCTTMEMNMGMISIVFALALTQLSSLL